MPHYSEMSFIFDSTASNQVTQILDNTSKNNTINVIKGNNNYIVHKNKVGTENIKNQLREQIYKDSSTNPYLGLIKDFSTTNGTPGAGLRLKASDFAYLRDLGVYPINRMAVLRRFSDGCFVPDNLGEMYLEPISTIVGWLKPDQDFGKIGFSETWGLTTKRFDQLLTELVQKSFGIPLSTIVPIPEFAQAILFQFYRDSGLVGTADADWDLFNIPVGNPNVLQEAPFRNPEGQNITSDFSFELVTTYEQKLLGNVDPGSAMLDILDNIYTMGTSNMVFYWSDSSKAMTKARGAWEGKANDPTAWWQFIKALFTSFWEGLTTLFNDIKEKVEDVVEKAKKAAKEKSKDATEELKNLGEEILNAALKTILTSTLAIHRFEVRGSIELMTGGKYSTTPWYLTLGNPYSPWISTNHIVVKSCSVVTSTEMGFNDQPQWLTATFTCVFSRALGRQELMKMFNNTYRRTYSSSPNPSTNEISKSEEYTDKMQNVSAKNITQVTPAAQVASTNSGTGKLANMGSSMAKSNSSAIVDPMVKAPGKNSSISPLENIKDKADNQISKLKSNVFGGGLGGRFGGGGAGSSFD